MKKFNSISQIKDDVRMKVKLFHKLLYQVGFFFLINVKLHKFSFKIFFLVLFSLFVLLNLCLFLFLYFICLLDYFLIRRRLSDSKYKTFLFLFCVFYSWLCYNIRNACKIYISRRIIFSVFFFLEILYFDVSSFVFSLWYVVVCFISLWWWF